MVNHSQNMPPGAISKRSGHTVPQTASLAVAQAPHPAQKSYAHPTLPRLSTVLFRYVTLDTEEICRRAFDVAKPHYLLSITSSYLSGKWPEK